MELRSFNVERIYSDCVTCVLGNDIGTKKAMLDLYTEDIRDMLSQIETETMGSTVCNLFGLCHIRKDGEQWTPYLQIVKMLMLLGRRLKFVDWKGELKPNTVITFKL